MNFRNTGHPTDNHLSTQLSEERYFLIIVQFICILRVYVDDRSLEKVPGNGMTK